MSTATSLPVQAEKPKHVAAQPRNLTILTAVTALALLIGLYMALVYAGTDSEQGHIQRIFYIHMPSFFGAFVAFSVTVVGGVQYLRTHETRWDTLALAGVEVGLALAIVNLVTGAIWARPIWNTWWNWDPRLTSDAVMVLTYSAYLMLRGGIENVDTRRRFASIYGIVAITTALLTLLIIRFVPETIHPAVVGPSPQNAEGTPRLGGTMVPTLLFNLVVWGALIPATLIWYRVRLQNFGERVNQMRLDLMER